MEKTSGPSASAMTLVPTEVWSRILRETMKSTMPVDLSKFLEVGEKFKGVRKWLEGKGSDNSEIAAWSKQYFLDRLDPGQMEHYQDWIAMNSTCRKFRESGKKAFFSEKTILMDLFLLYDLDAADLDRTGVEDSIKATALANIHHIIVPIIDAYPPALKEIPLYQALTRLSSLTIEPCHSETNALKGVVDRSPLPEHVAVVLQDRGLKLDKLHVDVQFEVEGDRCDLFGWMAENVDSEFFGQGRKSPETETEVSVEGEREISRI